MTTLLLFSVFVVATCGLIYELVAGALASYLLGDSVLQFSTVIGTYLFAMGIGSYLTRFVKQGHLRLFVQIEILVGLLGGFSSLLLFFAFGWAAYFQFVLYGIVAAIGIGVGLEIPLLMQILKDRLEFRDLISKVLSFDYVGALVASLAFPLLLLPHLGMVRTSLMFGIFNVGVAWLVAIYLGKAEFWAKIAKNVCAMCLVAMVIVFAYGDKLLSYVEASYYPDKVIYSKNSPYSRIVLSRAGSGMRLYLNGHLQFDSRDEYRYHEALVHVGLSSVKKRSEILILGGGDGMAAREVLKYPDVEHITLVDLDPEVTKLFKNGNLVSELNNHSLQSPKVTIINEDAFVWLKDRPQKYDFAVVDFPDPTNFSIGKLYTTAFYHRLMDVLSPEGAVVVQTTSPVIARKSFWCVKQTMTESGFSVIPYQTYVPSFGEWGFMLGTKSENFHPSFKDIPANLKYLSPEIIPTLFNFGSDAAEIPVGVNRLNNQLLASVYDKEWSEYER